MPDPARHRPARRPRTRAAAGAREPPRPHHRRHRHRQDGDPAGDGRTLQFDRRARVHGRREGRPRRHEPAGRIVAEARGAAEADRRRGAEIHRAFRSCSGTSSASRGIRCGRRSRDMGPLLLSRILNLNDTQTGVLTLVFKIADDSGLLLLDLKDLRALLQYAGDHAQDVPDELRQRVGGVDRRDPARIARARAAGRRQVPRRADAERRRPAADRRRPRRGQHPRRRPADAVAAALRDAAAVAAGRALRAAAGGRRPRQAEARVLLRRGAPAVHRRAEGAAGQDRAGRAADPLEGRGRVSSSRRIRSTCRTRCSASSATASSTRCARSRRATRRP